MASIKKEPWCQATLIRYWHGLTRDELRYVPDLKKQMVSSIKKLTLPLKREHEEMGRHGEGEIRFSEQDTAEDTEHGAKGIIP